MRTIVYTAMTLALAMGVSSAAHANPRFQVKNDTKKTIKVFIYNGTDTLCRKLRGQSKGTE